MAWNAQPGADRPPAAAELGLVRIVARADGSVGRILDGHLNGVERLAVQAPAELRTKSWRRRARADCGSASGAEIRARARGPRQRWSERPRARS